MAGIDGNNISIGASVVITGQGTADFRQPGATFASVAGVIVRASLSPANVAGSFCGVDVRNGRLLLGVMQGNYAPGRGRMTVLGEKNMAAHLDELYGVTAQARGTTITCSSGAVQITVTDTSLATGSVGLFTIGATARFTDATYCMP